MFMDWPLELAVEPSKAAVFGTYCIVQPLK